MYVKALTNSKLRIHLLFIHGYCLINQKFYFTLFITKNITAIGKQLN